MLRTRRSHVITSDRSSILAHSKPIRFPSRLWRLFLIAAVTILLPLIARAQNIQYTANSASLGLRGDFKVNPLTHALELQIPLGQGAYAQRGGAGLPTAISYSSRVWRMAYLDTELAIDPISHQPYPIDTRVLPKFAEHSRSGWTFSLGSPIIDDTSTAPENYDHSGNPLSQCVVGGDDA